MEILYRPAQDCGEVTPMRKLGLVIAAYLTACGGTSEGPCAQRSGTVRINMTTRSGTCGNIPEMVETQASQPTAPAAPCTGSITYSEDNCEVTVDATCPLGTDGSKLKTAGKATWNKEGTSGTAVLSVSATNAAGASTCYGTYDAKYTKL